MQQTEHTTIYFKPYVMKNAKIWCRVKVVVIQVTRSLQCTILARKTDRANECLLISVLVLCDKFWPKLNNRKTAIIDHCCY